jgi:carbamoyl-phosphate synthase large subunit
LPVKILITGAGAGPAIAVIKALKAQKELDLKVISIDMGRLAAGLYLSDDRYLVPAAEDADFIDTVLGICRKEGIDIVIPISDPETMVFANNIGRFKNLETKVLVCGLETAQIANDKLRAYKFCLENGILAPKVYSSEELEKGGMGFPLIIKSRTGRGARHAYKIEDPKELAAYLPVKEGYFVQEYIEGTEYTIDIISDNDGKILAVVPRERIVVKAGQIVKGRTVKDRRLMTYCEEVCHKLKIKWAACLQCKVAKDGRIFFIEVNPRYGTGVSLSIGAGLNIPLLQVKLALGLTIRKEELDFADNFYMIRYWEEIFIRGEDLIKPRQE